MTVDEAKEVIEQLEAQGNSKEEIAGMFYLLFSEGKIKLEELENMINLLGFHLTEEFKAMSPEEQKTEGYEIIDDEEDKAMELLKAKEKQQQAQPSQSSTSQSSTSFTKDEKEDNEKDEDEEKRAMKLLNTDR